MQLNESILESAEKIKDRTNWLSFDFNGKHFDVDFLSVSKPSNEFKSDVGNYFFC